MGLMTILDQSGDTTIEWDPNDSASTEKAHKEFKRLKDEGYEFYEVAEAKGKKVKRFSKKHAKLIAAPGVKSKKDKATGSRRRAMGGGPNEERPRDDMRSFDHVTPASIRPR